MRNLRTFSQEFKRQVVEELMSGESRPAQLCRRHNISPSLLYHWKKQYSMGKFNNEPIEEAALKDRIEKLERLVGRLTLENEFLKRGYSTISTSLGATGIHPPMAVFRQKYPERMPDDEYREEHVLLPAQGTITRDRRGPYRPH